MTAVEIPPDSDETPWVRTSERTTFTQCPQKWEWAYLDRIKPKTAKPALRFGSLIHISLEKFYLPGIKRGPHPAETFEKEYERELKDQVRMGFRDEDGEWHEAGELGVTMLNAYYEKFGADDRWYVVATEYPFHYPFRHPRTGKILFVYVGVMDGIWRDRESGKRKDLWVVDHKTTKDDPEKKAEALIMDEQAGAYWSPGVKAMREAGILKPDQKLTGMMYNFLRKGKPDDRPVNELGQSLNKPTKDALVEAYRIKRKEDPPKGATVAWLMEDLGPVAAQLGEVSAKQPTPLFHREAIRRYEADGAMVDSRIRTQYRLMRMMRDGDLAVYKVPGQLHNPHCRWCDYRDMCELHEQGAEWEEFRDATMIKWEPYSQHEIMEAR